MLIVTETMSEKNALISYPTMKEHRNLHYHKTFLFAS